MTTPPSKQRPQKDKVKDDEEEEIGDEDDNDRSEDEDHQYDGDEPITRIHSGGSGNNLAKLKGGDPKTEETQKKCSDCRIA